MQYTGRTLEGLVFRKFSLHQEKTDLKMQYTGRTLEGLVFRRTKSKNKHANEGN